MLNSACDNGATGEIRIVAPGAIEERLIIDWINIKESYFAKRTGSGAADIKETNAAAIVLLDGELTADVEVVIN